MLRIFTFRRQKTCQIKSWQNRICSTNTQWSGWTKFVSFHYWGVKISEWPNWSPLSRELWIVGVLRFNQNWRNYEKSSKLKKKLSKKPCFLKIFWILVVRWNESELDGSMWNSYNTNLMKTTRLILLIWHDFCRKKNVTCNKVICTANSVVNIYFCPSIVKTSGGFFGAKKKITYLTCYLYCKIVHRHDLIFYHYYWDKPHLHI